MTQSSYRASTNPHTATTNLALGRKVLRHSAIASMAAGLLVASACAVPNESASRDTDHDSVAVVPANEAGNVAPGMLTGSRCDWPKFQTPECKTYNQWCDRTANLFLLVGFVADLTNIAVGQGCFTELKKNGGLVKVLKALFKDDRSGALLITLDKLISGGADGLDAFALGQLVTQLFDVFQGLKCDPRTDLITVDVYEALQRLICQILSCFTSKDPRLAAIKTACVVSQTAADIYRCGQLEDACELSKTTYPETDREYHKLLVSCECQYLTAMSCETKTVEGKELRAPRLSEDIMNDCEDIAKQHYPDKSLAWRQACASVCFDGSMNARTQCATDLVCTTDGATSAGAPTGPAELH